MGSDEELRLDRILRAHGALPPPVLFELGIRIAEALQAAEDEGLSGAWDRVLEPATVLVSGSGKVPTSSIAQPWDGKRYGNLAAVYKAPEALEGHGGPRADVFVLGALLFEMASGDPLFVGRRAASGETLTKGLARRLEQACIPERYDGIAGGFGQLLSECLRLDKAQRHASAGAVARQLRKIRQGSGVGIADLHSFMADAAAAPTDGSEAARHSGLNPVVSVPGASPVPLPTEEAVPTEFQKTTWTLPESMLDESEASAPEPEAERDPWADDIESEQQLRKRMSAARLTPVDRTGDFRTIEEEPTFGKALKWFLKRIVLTVLAVFLLLLTIAWLGVFPGGSERMIARGWNVVPGPVRGAVPEGWVTSVQEKWAARPGQDVGRPVGAWMLGVMPESWSHELAEEAPTPTPTAGEPTVEGVVASAEGWIELVEDVPEGQGRLKLSVDLGGRARGDRVKVVAHPSGTEEVAGEGTADAALRLPDAHYDLELIYRESEYIEERRGWIRGARVAGDHQTSYVVVLDAPIGFIDASIELARSEDEEEEVTHSVSFSAWPEPAGDEPSGDPAWRAESGAQIGVEVGRWRVKAVLSEEGHAPVVVWFRNVPVEKGDKTTLKKTELRRGEPLDPTGPGVRIAITNGGTDVSTRARVLVFARGAVPANSVAAAEGPGAYYFDVPQGTWDIQVVFQPNADDPSLRAEKILKAVQIAPGQVVRRTVEMGLSIAELDIELWRGSVELTDAARVFVIRAGADFEGATRLLDEEGGGPHPMKPGTYDIYIQTELDGGWRTTGFEGVRLDKGTLWKQRLDVDRVAWRD